MARQLKYTLEDANQYFAVAYNGRIWQLLEKKERTEEENAEMINLAHASLLHWSKSSKCRKVNLQRGEYMISMAYIYTKNSKQALHYAERCKKITENNSEENEDFDLAYAYLVLAMALSLNKSKIEADEYLNKAKKLGGDIKGKKDRSIFLADLKNAIEDVFA